MVAELSVGREQVERVMRQVLGSMSARLSNWELEQLPYLSVLPGRALARLAGSGLQHAPSVTLFERVLASASGPVRVSHLRRRDAAAGTQAAHAVEHDGQQIVGEVSMVACRPGRSRSS
ncbi:MAG: hypothetical protein JO020_16370 [Chloroflexi bacterium]|nr:hypothetical protein [Chloroflexota bacterium]